MHMVIEYKQHEFIGILVGFGADLDQQDDSGNSALMNAV